MNGGDYFSDPNVNKKDMWRAMSGRWQRSSCNVVDVDVWNNDVHPPKFAANEILQVNILPLWGMTQSIDVYFN